MIKSTVKTKEKNKSKKISQDSLAAGKNERLLF
jgi:hypothetical protein